MDAKFLSDSVVKMKSMTLVRTLKNTWLALFVVITVSFLGLKSLSCYIDCHWIKLTDHFVAHRQCAREEESLTDENST